MIKLVLWASNKKKNFSTSNNLFFYKKMPINKSHLNKIKLTFPRWPTLISLSGHHDHIHVHRIWKKDVKFLINLSAILLARQTVNVNQREKDLNIFYFTFLHNLHVNQGGNLPYKQTETEHLWSLVFGNLHFE